MSKRLASNNYCEGDCPSKKQKQTPSKPYSPTSTLMNESPKLTKDDLKNSRLELKFVNRENESTIIVNTLVQNKRQQNLSQVKLVSLFQTSGIGKTSLVRRFREVYKNWCEESRWVKDLQLFELDFRLFDTSSEETIRNMSKKIAEFVIKEYNKQFISKFQPNESPELLQKRIDFHNNLLTITKQTDYGAKDIFQALNSDNSLPEGYLILVDQVDGILQHQFIPPLQDPRWTICKEGCDIYLTRFIELYSQVIPLLIPDKSAVIFSGHIPIHLALSDKQHATIGSPRSDYCPVFLSPMKKEVLNIMIEQSVVTKGNEKCITLLDALKLLGLNNIDEFIDILITYTGAVPRIMENAFISMLHNFSNLSSHQEICEAFQNSDQQGLTLDISNDEEAKLVSHLCLLHSFDISIPAQTKVYFSKRYRNYIEILPYLKMHFQVMEDKTVKIIIPKLLKDDILLKLSKFKTISGVRYSLLKSNLNALKGVELAIIDLLAEQITLSFSKTNQVTIFGDLCGGIFKETFFNSLEIPHYSMTDNILILGFSTTSHMREYLNEYLYQDYESLTSVLDNAMSDNPFCTALNKTPLQLLRKLLLFEMKLYEKDFSLTNLQEEINQVSNFLPNTYSVEEKPTLEGENLHFTLIIMVMEYSESLQRVIETNANRNGSLLITGTCYLENERITYTRPNVGSKSWLKLRRGGFEVLLLTRKGLENLLSKDLCNTLFHNVHNKKEVYREMICKIGFTQRNGLSAPKQIKHTPILRRATNFFQIKSFEYDTTDCTSWSIESINAILLSPRKQGGIGFTEKQIVNIDIDGTNFENIIDALLRFNGDEEAKIEHATKNLDKNLKNHATSKSVVRWIFSNLLEYK